LALPSGEVKPWGRWSTFGLGLIALLAGQMAALVALTWWYGQALAQLPNFSGDGVAVSLVILVSTPVQLALLVLMARQTGDSAAHYLGFVLPWQSHIVVAVIAVVAFIALGDTISFLLGQGVVTSFQRDIYRSASAQGWLPVLWLVVVVVTPIGEETLFRGFLFRGWHRSPRDAWVVIAVTALLFAAVHVQYDFLVILQVFGFGLLLGWFRWATGSTILTMLMHALVNCEGMLETLLAHHG
jgi:membrane protease YdiL (CAAX protease family)